MSIFDFEQVNVSWVNKVGLMSVLLTLNAFSTILTQQTYAWSNLTIKHE